MTILEAITEVQSDEERFTTTDDEILLQRNDEILLQRNDEILLQRNDEILLQGYGENSREENPLQRNDGFALQMDDLEEELEDADTLEEETDNLEENQHVEFLNDLIFEFSDEEDLIFLQDDQIITTNNDFQQQPVQDHGDGVSVGTHDSGIDCVVAFGDFPFEQLPHTTSCDAVVFSQSLTHGLFFPFYLHLRFSLVQYLKKKSNSSSSQNNNRLGLKNRFPS